MSKHEVQLRPSESRLVKLVVWSGCVFFLLCIYWTCFPLWLRRLWLSARVIRHIIAVLTTRSKTVKSYYYIHKESEVALLGLFSRLPSYTFSHVLVSSKPGVGPVCLLQPTPLYWSVLAENLSCLRCDAVTASRDEQSKINQKRQQRIMKV